ncbi:MerR family transcriptional regulator [Kribbella sp. NPDC023855]|uniref:MerR family transcriptional regulator n=1 Tax=Kribbella sp. NPDC023855 TaxID=3154698 RepID=UPI0033FFE290
MRDDLSMLTIGQLARTVGVSTKTIRVYHDKGLLPEPDRDSSGYRRYDAQAVAGLIKIRTLSEAGVPLARIRELSTAAAPVFHEALDEIDNDLTARIRKLRHTQQRLRDLAAGRIHILPAEVDRHLQQLEHLGFTPRWAAMERDLWVVMFATLPDTAKDWFQDQVDALTDPVLRQLYLTYDQAHDLDPGDPALEALAEGIVTETIHRYGSASLPAEANSSIPQLLQGSVNDSSPAWQRLDSLIRHRLRQAGTEADPSVHS